MLEIKDLQVKVENKIILNNINLCINKSELHVVLGPNGHGKSTLLQVIIGNPNYVITKGDILFNSKSILELKPEERSKLGIFLGWQNPVSAPGVLNLDYLKLLINSHSDHQINTFEFFKKVDKHIDKLNLSFDFRERYLNVGFSGGEKKRNEILQMLLSNPNFIMLDEIDSGLDVDSMYLIQDILKQEFNKENVCGLLVSHYSSFLNNLPVKKVHILINGHIYETGDSSLINKVHKEGFLQFYKKYNIKNEDKKEILGTCGVKDAFS